MSAGGILSIPRRIHLLDLEPKATVTSGINHEFVS